MENISTADLAAAVVIAAGKSTLEPEYVITQICKNFTCMNYLTRVLFTSIIFIMLCFALPVRFIFYLMRRQRYFIEISMLWCLFTAMSFMLYALYSTRYPDPPYTPMGKLKKSFFSSCILTNILPLPLHRLAKRVLPSLT